MQCNYMFINMARWVQAKAVALTVCGFSQPLQAAPQLSNLTAQLVNYCSLRICRVCVCCCVDVYVRGCGCSGNTSNAS